MNDMEYDMYALGIMVVIVSFLGFVVENVWLAITKGYINNRNMNAPFLLGYGLLVVCMYLVLGTPASMTGLRVVKKMKSAVAGYLLYFLCAFVIVSVGEIVLGTIVERMCHIEYWNYSNLLLHVTKYTSVPTSIAFAGMLTFFMGKCFAPLMGWISQMGGVCVQILSAVLLGILVWDFVVSFRHMIREKDFNMRWKISIK